MTDKLHCRAMGGQPFDFDSDADDFYRRRE